MLSRANPSIARPFHFSPTANNVIATLHPKKPGKISAYPTTQHGITPQTQKQAVFGAK